MKDLAQKTISGTTKYFWQTFRQEKCSLIYIVKVIHYRQASIPQIVTLQLRNESWDPFTNNFFFQHD
jgi:hypothetical protein